MRLERQPFLLLEGKLEGFDQWFGGIFSGVGKLQLDLKAEAFGQTREVELGGGFLDLFGETLDVIIAFLGFLPCAPLVGFAVLVGIHAHSGLHFLDPGTGAKVIVGGLCDQIEASLGEPDVGIGVAFADFPAESERFVDAGGGEPGDSNPFLGRMKIAKKVVLPADGNGSPVAVGVLLGLVDFVLRDVGLEPLRVLLGPVRVKVFGDLAGRLGAFVHRGGNDGVPVDSVRTDGMAGEWRIPGMPAGIDRAPVLEDDVKPPLNISNNGTVRTMGRIIQGDAHVLSGFAVGEVLVDEQVRVLVIGEVIVDKGFPIDLLGRRHPAGKSRGDASVVHPVDHVLALPGMVTPLSLDESAGGIELGRDGSGFQGGIEPVQLGVLRFEGLLSFLFRYAAVTPEHPVVFWALGQKHGRVPQVLRSDPGLCFPVLPKRGLLDGERFSRALLLEGLHPGPQGTCLGGGGSNSLLDGDALTELDASRPFGRSSDRPRLFAKDKLREEKAKDANFLD